MVSGSASTGKNVFLATALGKGAFVTEDPHQKTTSSKKEKTNKTTHTHTKTCEQQSRKVRIYYGINALGPRWLSTADPFLD